MQIVKIPLILFISIIVVSCGYYIHEIDTPEKINTAEAEYNKRSDSFVVDALNHITDISYTKSQTSEYLVIYTKTSELYVYRNTSTLDTSWRFCAYKANGRYSDYDYRIKGDNNLSDSTYIRLKTIMNTKAKK